jgi:hypothetical protein
MAISTYLIKKDGYEFDQILSEGYSFDYQPVILNQSTKADGSIKTIYAQYSNITISIKFGNLNGTTIQDYANRFLDGEYEVWNPNTRAYETYDFVVTKNPLVMISSQNGERFNDLEVTLIKASEVGSWSV